MAKSKHYGPGPPTESFVNFDKDKETEKENSSSSKSYGDEANAKAAAEAIQAIRGSPG